MKGLRCTTRTYPARCATCGEVFNPYDAPGQIQWSRCRACAPGELEALRASLAQWVARFAEWDRSGR